MSQNIYCNPSLIIDNTEIEQEFRMSIDMKGDNTINEANITMEGDNFNESKLFGREVQVFLNMGSLDSVPIFRGYIREIKPSETSLNIKVQDPRCFLAGKDSPEVIQEDGTYDGYTLAQFTYRWINDVINKDDIKIGLDMLNETVPAQPLSTAAAHAIRANAKAYDLIKRGIDLNRDHNGKQILKYQITMMDDGEKSNIVFLKDKDLDEPAVCKFSYTDGIVRVSYSKTPLPTFVMVGQVKYQIGSEPNGAHLLVSEYLPDLAAYQQTPAEISEMIIQELEMRRELNERKITLVATKGHYLALGDLVYLDVSDAELQGKHKVTAKKLTIGRGKMNVTLSLSKRIMAQ